MAFMVTELGGGGSTLSLNTIVSLEKELSDVLPDDDPRSFAFPVNSCLRSST